MSLENDLHSSLKHSDKAKRSENALLLVVFFFGKRHSRNQLYIPEFKYDTNLGVKTN